ncbi:type II toxin-antitoxin system VapC family toxin [Magnetococcales bacterium HHB-1]
MLIDSDIIIWFLKGDWQAAYLLNDLEVIQISAVTHMEILQGIRNKRELSETKKTFDRYNVQIIYISHDISKLAIALIERYALSHGLRFGDALIAATAITHQIKLYTINAKHFLPLKEEGLDVEVFRRKRTH